MSTPRSLADHKKDDAFYSVFGEKNLPKKIVLSDASITLLWQARPGQGLVGVGWKDKKEDILHLELVVGFNAFHTVKKGYLRSNRFGKKYIIYDKDKVYSKEEFKDMAVFTPVYSNLIHIAAVEVLQKSDRIPKDIPKEHMIGFGVIAGHGNMLLDEFRVSSFNLNLFSIKWNREYILTQYYGPPDVNLLKHERNYIEKDLNYGFKLLRPLPVELSRLVLNTVLTQAKQKQKQQRKCRNNIAIGERQTAKSEQWWKRYQNHPTEKNKALVNMLFTCIRIEEVEEKRNKLVDEILYYMKINQAQIVISKGTNNFTKLDQLFQRNDKSSEKKNTKRLIMTDTCLSLAVKMGYCSIVEKLIAAGAAKAVTESTDAFTLAIKKNDVAIMKVLLESCSLTMMTNFSYIFSAVNSGQYEISKLLILHYDKEPPSSFSKNQLSALIDQVDLNSNTLLMHAAKAGDEDLVNFLLLKGPKLDKKNNQGETALLLAAKYGHVKIVELLLSKKDDININAQNIHGDTALMVAAQGGCNNTKPSGMLVEQKSTGLMHSVDDEVDTVIEVHDEYETESVQYLAIIKLLLKADGNLLKKNSAGKTAFLIAAENGQVSIVEHLLDKSDIHSTDLLGNTALILAAEKSHGAVVRLLILNGADPEKMNFFSQTALDKALRVPNNDVVINLLKVLPTVLGEAESTEKLSSPIATTLVTAESFTPALISTSSILEIDLTGVEKTPLIPDLKSSDRLFTEKPKLAETDIFSDELRTGIEETKGELASEIVDFDIEKDLPLEDSKTTWEVDPNFDEFFGAATAPTLLVEEKSKEEELTFDPDIEEISVFQPDKKPLINTKEIIEFLMSGSLESDLVLIKETQPEHKSNSSVPTPSLGSTLLIQMIRFSMLGFFCGCIAGGVIVGGGAAPSLGITVVAAPILMIATAGIGLIAGGILGAFYGMALYLNEKKARMTVSRQSVSVSNDTKENQKLPKPAPSGPAPQIKHVAGQAYQANTSPTKSPISFLFGPAKDKSTIETEGDSPKSDYKLK